MLEDENKISPGQEGAAEHNPASGQASQYSPQAEQIDVSVMGNNYGSVINQSGLSVSDVVLIIQGLSSSGLVNGAAFSSSSVGRGDAHKSQLADMVGQELQDAVMDSEAAADDPGGSHDPAAMPAEIDEWYYDKLDDYERAYVIAVAVLQGSPANDITRKAHELSQLSVSGSSGPMAARSASRLRKNTYTMLREGGDPRIFWKNPDFGLRMLRFIAEESLEWPGSQPGQSFIDMLQSWVEELSGESSRRAARQFGSILAYQSTNQLIRVANGWANRKNVRDWRMAASLLNGAYEVGLSSQNGRASGPLTNAVLGLLAQWNDRWLQTGNAQVGCAAAHTFALLGRRSPTTALQGLERLLQPSQRGIDAQNSGTNGAKNILPGQLASAIVQGYVALSFAGHSRLVLHNLAAHAELLVHQYQQPTRASQYIQYKKQREAVLDLTFDAFFLIAASSLSASSPNPSRSYGETLPEELSLPDRNGRDLLLTALLAAQEVAWRNDLTTLLCAAIIEGKSRPAFDVLQQWANIVLSQPQDRLRELYAPFVTFMITLGKTLRLWCSDLASKGIDRSSALQAYQHRLTTWQQTGSQPQNGIRALAKYVLQLTT